MSTPNSEAAVQLTVAQAGEHAIIDRIRRRVPPAPPWVVQGIGDDAAVIEPARNELDVFTTDALVEGVHFDRRFVPARAIGHKALAVNLSDLAAMGATPRVALLSLALPGTLRVADLDELIAGLLSLAGDHRVHLVGGNVARSPGALVIDVTAIGSVRRRRVLRRIGAVAGDELYVSGALGAAAAGLERLVSSADGRPLEDVDRAGEECEQRFLQPEPRLRLGSLLGRNRAATSCIDLSDGLADGVRQLTSANAVGAVVDAASIPIHPGARAWFERRGADPLEAAIRGGEDYELVFTVSPKKRSRFAAVRQLTRDLPLTRIGTITPGRDVVLQRGAVRQEWPDGYAHFR